MGKNQATARTEGKISSKSAGDGLVTLYASKLPALQGEPWPGNHMERGKGAVQGTLGAGTSRRIQGGWGILGGSLNDWPRIEMPGEDLLVAYVLYRTTGRSK